MLQHLGRVRRVTRSWDARCISCPFHDPVGGFIAIYVEVVQVVLHVCVVRVWRADGIVGLAVLAESAGVGVGLEAGELLCVARCAAV